MKHPTVFVIVLLCLCSAWPRAMQIDLDTRAIQEAIAIGQSRISGERDRFQARYRVRVAKAPVDYIEVITPFRRVVLAAQGQAAVGNRGFGQRDALETLAAAPGILELRVELTFHPLNTYVGVPDYRVGLVSGPRRIDPESLDRIPRYGPRVDGLPAAQPRPAGLPVIRRSEPMLGGTVVAQFDARALDANGAYDVVISEEGRDLARARVDLATVR